MIHHSVEPSERMRRIFEEHVTNYGDPDLQYEFGQGEHELFHRLDVFVWQATTDIPMTTFSTSGMADLVMKDAGHRCEMHWTIRGMLAEKDISSCSYFLSKLAEYPFIKNAALDHWHIVAGLDIPIFPKCSNLLFHPTFVKDGWDKIDWNGETIKILNIVPLTDEEYREAVTSGVNVMLDRLFQSRIDIFSNRP
jgi:hypothetical protein